MGAEAFQRVVNGKTAQEAFALAVSDAQHESGHSGYTGTVAEKSGFRVLSVPDEVVHFLGVAGLVAHFESGDHDVYQDKWGPAGCVDLLDGSYLFFGIASS